MGIELRWDGMLTWGIATLATVYLLSSTVSGMISGGAFVLGGATSAAASTVSAASRSLGQPGLPLTCSSSRRRRI